MQLSKRLLMVTNFVRKGSVVADVGCDHAYISIYLVLNKIAKRTYALDVNKGPLEKAKANINSYNLSDFIETRLSNGLQKLVPDKVDTIVIAGMGGSLAIKILMEGKESVDYATDLVLQVQSDLDKVRQYLHTINFIIVEEAMCKEDGKFYTAMHAVKDQKKDSLNLIETKYGKYLLETKNEILKENLIKEYSKALSIKEKLESEDSENARLRLESLKEEICDLENALSYYDEIDLTN